LQKKYWAFVKLIKASNLHSTAIHEHESTGAVVSPLLGASHQVSVVRIELKPHGLLGRHQAAEDQVFIIVRGSGFVSGEDSESSKVHEGDVVFWRSGESHETRAGPDGLNAIVVEGKSLGKALQAG